jgi:hypothetical protein
MPIAKPFSIRYVIRARKSIAKTKKSQKSQKIKIKRISQIIKIWRAQSL